MMMRIAYICTDPGVPVFGRKGCSIHVQEVIRALRRRGADVTLFATRLGEDVPGDLGAVRVRPLVERLPKPAADRELALIRLNDRLPELLREMGEFDAVYERHALWGWGAMEFARAEGIPGLLEVNAPLLEEQSRYRVLIHRATAERGVRRAFDAADHLLAVSEGVAVYARLIGAPESRVRVVRNAVNPARFDGITRDATNDRPPVIGFVGTLKPWHGVDALIRAFAHVHRQRPDARLLIVGDGPQRQAIEAQITALQLNDAVELTGAVGPDEIPAALSRMDIAVAPYPELDGFYFSPLKVYEYMAARCAIIASEVGEIPDVLADGRTGLLYPPGDVEALAARLMRLCDDFQMRVRLGEQARARAESSHTWDDVARRIVALIGAGRCAASLREVG